MFNKSKKMRVFRKSFLIAFISTCVVMLGAIIAWNRLVAPPDQSVVIARPIDDQPVVDEEGFLIVSLEHSEEIEDEDDDTPPPLYNAPSWAEGRRGYFWTFLIIGLNEGTNANTIMVASYCGIAREANLISIPRDIPVHPNRNGGSLVHLI